jgi:hypothetical protein
VSLRDFFQGRPQLRDLQTRADYQFLSSNIRDRTTLRPLFSPVFERRGEDVAVRILSVGSPKDGPQAKHIRSDSVGIAEPVQCLKKLLDSLPSTADSLVTLCLLEKTTLDQYPALLDIKGIDVFVCGLPAFDPNRGRTAKETLLESGKRIVYVPAFNRGVGRLSLTRDPDGDSMAVAYTTFDPSTAPPDTAFSRHVRGLVEKWTNLFNHEKNSFVAQMDEPLSQNQTEVVGNLLRERTRCDLACLENSLVSDASLPRSITMQDLDRLLTSSPDLLRWRLSGGEINRMRRITGLVWVGTESGDGIDNQEIYTVVLTENAYTRITAEVGNGMELPAPRHMLTSVMEAVEKQLTRRKRRNYDFDFLDGRWRRAGTITSDVSLRHVSVSNPDSIGSLSGVSYEPFSNWNLNLSCPLSIYNRYHRFEFVPELEYSAYNGLTEQNFMEFTLDYRYTRLSTIGPYASADYQTFITNREAEEMPIGMRSTFGVVVSPEDWTFKFGFGAEKNVFTTKRNPMVPLSGILFGGLGMWNPAFELSAEGSYSISDLMKNHGVRLFANRQMRVNLLWDNRLGLPQKEARLESRFNVDLSADIIPGISVHTGYHIFYARFLSDKRSFYNLEPTLSLFGSFPFKW